MSNLSKTFGLLGALASTTSKQPQSLTCKQSRKLTIPLLALLSITMLLLTLTEGTGFAQTFTTADFEGTWNFRGLVSGYPGDFESWAYGTMTCDSNGDFVQWATNRTGEINQVSGTLEISPERIITIPGGSGHGSAFHGVMNGNKDVIVATLNDGGGGYALIIFTKAGGTFTTGDLEGVWNYHGLISGDPPDERPGWFYSSMTIDSDGNTTSTPIIDSEGNKDYIPTGGSLSITEDGLVTLSGAPAIYGVMNQGKDMTVTVATMAPGDIRGVRGYNLMVGLKTGGTFTESDLQGTWYWHGLASGDDTAWQGWFHTTTVVDSSGNLNFVPGSYLNSSGETDITQSGTMSITSDGIVTIPGKPDAHGRMSIDKDMIVMTMDDGGGGYDLIIIVKAGAPDIQAIKDAYAGIEVAVETEDTDTLMSYFSDDFFHDDQDKIHWWTQFQQLFDNYQNIQVEFTNVQIAVNGNAAATTLHVKITGELQDGGAVETITDEDMSEDYLNYWLKEDGIWRLYGNQPLMIPMTSFDFSHGGWNGLNIYLYDCVSKTMNTVKQNTYDSHGASLNTDHTTMAYTEGWRSNPYSINVYDIASRTSTTIATDIAELAAYFDRSGKILFIHSGTGVLKKMDADGKNITVVENPEPPYFFSMFWMSPDREKILVIECRRRGSDYETGKYERLVLMNSDGTDRTVIKEEYLGEWNLLSWRLDSNGFLYYHHVFNDLSGEDFEKFPKYLAFDLAGDTITINDLSNSDIGKEENFCHYTKLGNLLSLTYRELYNGQTGTLIADRPSDVPLITETMFGFDNNGEIYFADLNGSNFRKFVEIPADLNYE